MLKLKKFIIIIILLNILPACNEKISYSGKIFDKNAKFIDLTKTNDLLSMMGEPNYIDPIENKYYYISEKEIYKNFFKQEIDERNIIVFSIEGENITNIKMYNSEDEKDINVRKEITENNLLERGIIEKVFGGVGKQKLPN